MRIAIAGTGYVGIVTAGVLAAVGHKITCVDVDKEKVQKLKEGICPIFEPELTELLKRNRASLDYTTDYKQAYKDAEVIFIAVGTPEKSDGSADLKYVYEVAKQIAQSVKKDTVVVIKSTVPIGTHDKVKIILDEETKGNDFNIDIVSNPEFLSQGTAVRDMQNPSRIVIGTENDRAKRIMKKVYETFVCPKVFTDCRSAEMIKYASNDFLALKVSYINEIANVCELVGANIEEVALGMGYDQRIGNMFLKAGIGYGGSCFPKDTKALHWLAGMYDYEIKTIKASIEVNKEQKIKLVKKLKREKGDLRGKKIAVLGLAFKSGTDDVRESPALSCIPLLWEEGAVIKAWDPFAANNFSKIMSKEGIIIEYHNTIEETIAGTEACLIITNWQDILNFDIDKYKILMSYPLIIDGRNCYPLEKIQNKEIIYISIGRRDFRGIIQR